jgi:hypothetical protein
MFMSVEKIEIHEFISGRMHGDRATRQTDCSLFKVQIFNSGSDKPFTAFKQDSYEWFHCHVTDRKEGFAKATEYAKGFAESTGYTGKIKHRTFREKLTPSWVEV